MQQAQRFRKNICVLSCLSHSLLVCIMLQVAKLAKQVLPISLSTATKTGVRLQQKVDFFVYWVG